MRAFRPPLQSVVEMEQNSRRHKARAIAPAASDAERKNKFAPVEYEFSRNRTYSHRANVSVVILDCN